MHNRSTFMKSVWAHFRRVALPGCPFCRKLFAQVLAFMWKSERIRIQAAREAADRIATTQVIVSAPVRPMSEMEACIDALKYPPFRYSLTAVEAAIRAEYAA